MGHDLPPLPLRDVHTVRWYVLSLPACHKGPAKGLEKELDRRVRLGEPTFDFFAPSFVEMHRREGAFGGDSPSVALQLCVYPLFCV